MRLILALLVSLPFSAPAFEVQAGVFGGLRIIETLSDFESRGSLLTLGPTVRGSVVVSELFAIELGYAQGGDLLRNAGSFKAVEVGARFQYRNWPISPTAAIHLQHSWDCMRGRTFEGESTVLETNSQALLTTGGIAAHLTEDWTVFGEAMAGFSVPDPLFALLGRVAVGYRF